MAPGGGWGSVEKHLHDGATPSTFLPLSTVAALDCIGAEP